ncbi:hypothetical protein GTQ34_11720 [Muricauda sp. JGD-17]|uniref:HTH LytTR-type domain-containing protein n=1 Tax=Flagellimonas ochracea TaxID=2696472 RepID=A0A964TED5_9FLAO|nr:LytTR family DNA-binding domain-containing protein [Allomuricauda ochracea]NAY92586.1 hypothetical protein [Allomuricauda ochracea]
MKTRNLFILTTVIATLLGFLIHWREYETREQVSLLHVLIWQLVIWTPWIMGFKGLEKTIKKTKSIEYGDVYVFGYGFLWICFHYGWFVLISSNFSPYREFSGFRFGVYRYFFIFWTLIDIGLLWFAIDKLKSKAGEEDNRSPLFELTRGDKKYFCNPSQIHWLVAENYYTKLSTTEGIFMMRRTLKSFHDVLPSDNFKKIHRSTIVNVDYVSEISRGNTQSLEVVLKDGTRRRVSRSFAKEILQFFKNRTY